MKTLFIPAKINFEIDEKKIKSFKLPKNLAIAYSIQYEKTASEIKRILSKNHNIISFIQILGCSRPKLPKNTDATLLISSGRFHAVSLALESKLPVYLFENNHLIKISYDEIKSIENKKRASYVRFLNSDKVGILVSTKPGQENLQKAILFKQKLKNKKTYLFVSNQLNFQDFENFPDIHSWINTACPRLDFDSSIINMSNIEKILNPYKSTFP